MKTCKTCRYWRDPQCVVIYHTANPHQLPQGTEAYVFSTYGDTLPKLLTGPDYYCANYKPV